MGDYVVAAVTALATLGAAYGGASYAFSLQRDREYEDRKNAEINSGNITLFYLTKMYGDLRDYQTQVIDPNLSDPFKYYHIRPTLPSVIEENISYDDLAFVLTDENPSVLARLSLSITSYKRSMQKIEERSIHHLNTVQPKMEESGVTAKLTYSHNDFESVLGERDLAILIQSTEDVIQLVGESLTLLKESHDQMFELLKKRHPGSKIIKMNDT